jgi:uncharacterized protein YbjT (DUF2867 family)
LKGYGVQTIPNLFKTDVNFKQNLIKEMQKVGIQILVIPPLYDVDFEIKCLVEAAKAAQVEHIIHLSPLYLTDLTSKFPEEIVEMHKQSEATVFNSGISYTLLRINILMQEFTEWFLSKQSRAFFLPALHGKISWLDAKDIALSIMSIIENPPAFNQQTYTLTGSSAISCEDAVKLFSSTLQLPFSSVPASEGKIKKRMMERLVVNETQVENMLFAFKYALGKDIGSAVSMDIKKITASTSRTFEEYIEGERESFEGKFKLTISVVGSMKYVCPLLFEKLFFKGFKTKNIIFSPLDRDYENTIYSLAGMESAKTKGNRKASISLNSAMSFSKKMRKFLKGAGKAVLFVPQSSHNHDALPTESLFKTIDICNEIELKHIVLVSDFPSAIQNKNVLNDVRDYLAERKIAVTEVHVNYTHQQISQLIDYQLQIGNSFSLPFKNQTAMSIIDADDVATALERIITEPTNRFYNKILKLTGSKCLSVEDISAIV